MCLEDGPCTTANRFICERSVGVRTSAYSCFDGYSKLFGRCYLIYTRSATILEASNYCQQNGGDLAIIRNVAEYTSITSMITVAGTALGVSIL